jgi:hypothetical protein
MVKALFLLALTPFVAAAAPMAPGPIAASVSEARLRATVTSLVGFGTRHTLSSQTDPRRGIGAAQHWVAEEFGRYSRACGNCLTIAKPDDTVSGPRVPNPTHVVDVLAIQRGTSDPNRVIIISGHLDSRVTDVMNAMSDAPGANDDGSGTAAVIEAARILSAHKFPATIVYAALTGEEQGLLGGKILAEYAKAQGWQVEAVLNNDIVGSSEGSDGVRDDSHVRLLSEGVRGDWNPELIAAQRSLGGENDSPSRNLSRFVAGLADELGLGLDVRQIWRTDRFGRGGDHLESQKLGFPAIRFTVAIENYNWQHQDLRTENGIVYGDTIDRMDFAYLAKVTKLNIATMAALALAPMPPEPKAEGAVSTDTTLSWAPVPGATGYVVRWRRTDASAWEHSLRLPAAATGEVLKSVRVDDWVFGVASVAADGFESPVASAVPGGAFKPYVSPVGP